MADTRGRVLHCVIFILVFQQLLANLTVQNLKTGSNFLFRRGKIGKTEHFARNIDLNLSSVLVVNCESNAKALESCLKDRPVIRRKERRKESGTITTPVATNLVIRVIKLTNLVFAAGVLMQANDILRNPGPHCLTCSLCSKKIRKNQGQVVCEACCGHFHLKCIGPDFEVTKCCKNCAFMSTPESMDGSESNETFIPKLDGLTDLLKQKGLKLCHQNMRSLLPKIDELRIIFNTNKGMNVIGLSETHLDATISDSESMIDGYKLYRRDRGNNSRAGGVIFYISESLPAIRRNDLERANIEGIWTEILQPHAKGILLGTIYRPPDGSDFLDANFMEALDEVLHIASAEEKEVIIMADLNCNFMSGAKSHSETKKLKGIFRAMNFSQLVDKPTRTTRDSQTIIDIIATCQPQNISHVQVVPTTFCYHDMVGCVRKLHSIKFKPRIIKRRNYAKYNACSFNKDLEGIPWEPVSNVTENGDINEAWTNFKTKFTEVTNKHAPLIEKKVRGRETPWLSNEIKQLMRERDYAHRKARKTNKELDWSAYRRLRNRVNMSFRKAKENYSRKVVDENADNPRNFWKIVKRVIPNKATGAKSSTTNPINVDGRVTTEATTIANGFCTFFTNIVKRIQPDQTPVAPTAQTKNCSSPSGTSFQMKPTSKNFVCQQLKLLKTSKATGLDGIPARLLKDAAPTISAPLTAIINLSISTSTVPKEWKLARLVCLHKDGDKTYMDNYRPLSILPVASKILERVVQKQLIDYLAATNQLSPHQFGFRKHHSTQDAVTFFADHIRKGIDLGSLTGAVFIDMRKVFDTVNHTLLLNKLNDLGINGKERTWFTSYLTDRRQLVMYNGTLSEPQAVVSGVPQGSILGPVFFTIYINDLPSHIQTAQVLLYADDTVIFHSSSDTKELKRVLQQDLNYLQIWARENRLSIHPIKTEAVLFGTHQRIAVNNELNLVLGNACVKRVQHYKYLGITLDANLNFHEHVERLHCKLSSRLGALRRTRKHLTVDAANKVYTATILPLLDYCDIAWSSIGKTACARLDKLQERASKLILPQSREPLKHLKWLPLAKRRDMHTTTMTFRCMSGKVPVSFKQYFKRNSCPYELRKNKNNLMIPRVNTEIARGSFYYSGAKLYNNLPNKIKTSLSMSALKEFYFK